MCSAHFQEVDFIPNRNFLKPTAVPSVFNLPPHLQKTAPRERVHSVQRAAKKRAAEDACSMAEDTVTAELAKRRRIELCVAHDHAYTYTSMEGFRNAMLRYKRLSELYHKKWKAAHMRAYRVSFNYEVLFCLITYFE